MNNTKRMFAWVMTVAMIMSMLSGFGVVTTANLAFAATSNVDINGTGTGATPVNDANDIDVLAEDVLIVDAGISVNNDVYSIVWNNEQIDGVPVAGKVFKTLSALELYVTENDIYAPTVIIKNSTADVFEVNIEATFYADAYGTMPFTVGANPAQPWTYNPEFEARTIKLPKVVIGEQVEGFVEFYGFTFTEGFVDTNRTLNAYFTFENCAIEVDGIGFDFENSVTTEENADSLYIKNLYVKSMTKDSSLFSQYIPAFTEIDGIYLANTSSSANVIKQIGGYTAFSLTNGMFENSEIPFAFKGDTKNAMKRSNIKTVEIKNNTILGVSDADNPFILDIAPSRYTSLELCNNYIASNGGSADLIKSTADTVFNDTRFDLTVRTNIMNGVNADFALKANDTTLRYCKMDVADNFLTEVYADDLTDVVGVELNATAHDVKCKSYYTDYKLQNKVNGSVAIVSASATNGDVFVNNSSNTVYYIMKSGDATELTLTFGDANTEYNWYADAECTQKIEKTDVSFAATAPIYYIKSFFTNSEGSFESDPYTVTVVREIPTDPYFAENYVDANGVLSNKALFCYIDCGWVTDGSLVSLEWQGEKYTFIKGVNLFENVEAAINFAKSNNKEEAQFVLFDMNGKSGTEAIKWFPSMPGSYFTANYATKPYVGDPTMAPELWASNVGVASNQYNVKEGVTLQTLSITGKEPEGDYKFYGFTFTGGISDTRLSSRPGCINIFYENCYFNVPGWPWALFIGQDSDTNAALGNTQDIMSLKDCYINGNGSAGRLFSGWQASKIYFDGLFLHAGSYSTTSDYMKQNTKTAEFRITNSHFKEYSTDWQNQANNKVIAAGETKVLEVSNTIFNNARLNAKAAIPAYTKAWSEITIKNNTIINETVNNFQVFQVVSDSSHSTNPCLLTVTGNKSYGTIGTFSFGSRARHSNSVVADNYTTTSKYQGAGTTTYGGIKLSAVSGTTVLLTGNYFVDSDLSIRPDKRIDDYNFVGSNVVYDPEAKTIKYIPLETGEIGFIEEETTTGFKYTINLAHIIENKYGNKMTLSNGTTSVDAYQTLEFKSQQKLDVVELVLSVSSPDGSEKPINYAVSITKNGPVIKDVKVDGQSTTYANNKYSIELSGRGSNEAITVVANDENATVSITKDGTPVDKVDVLNGASVTYKVSVTLNGETVYADLVVTRRGAEFDAFDQVLEQIQGVSSEDWLVGFDRAFQNLKAQMSNIDRATAIQSDVDSMTAQMNKLLADAVTEAEFRTFIKEAKRIKNTDGKYCTGKYANLQSVIAKAEKDVNSLSTAEEYNALKDTVTAAMTGLEHTFGEYVHDANSETCSSHGTKSAKCTGCEVKDTKPETDTSYKGGHVYGDYIYNHDATTEKDGTKTAICKLCKYANTITAEGTKIVVVNAATVFTDVAADGWYKEYVDHAVTYKLMNGTGDATFAPNKTITRAEFVQILANITGIDTTNNDVETKFTDVAKGQWYTAAVKWAAENGIVTGTSDTTFAPNAVITREQVCVMLANYAAYAKITLKTPVEKTEFADDAKISSWAKDAVYGCQMAGIVTGKGNGFAPLDTATRAEVAVIISIAHQNYLLA